MARVTVEDCIKKVHNRFDLVLLASGRAKALSLGMPATVPLDNDKNTIIALREIEEETINVDDLRNSLIAGMQKYGSALETSFDEEELKAVEDEIAGNNYKDSDFADSDAFQVVDEV